MSIRIAGGGGQGILELPQQIQAEVEDYLRGQDPSADGFGFAAGAAVAAAAMAVPVGMAAAGVLAEALKSMQAPQEAAPKVPSKHTQERRL